MSKSLRFSFFGLKNQIFRFCVCSGIGVAQLWEAILKICSFFPRKRNFFFKFMQSLMRTSPQFYDYGKYALRFEVFKTENESVWNDAPKKLRNILWSTAATFEKKLQNQKSKFMAAKKSWFWKRNTLIISAHFAFLSLQNKFLIHIKL